MHTGRLRMARRTLSQLKRSFGLLLPLFGLASLLNGCGGNSSTSSTLVRSINAYIAAPGADPSLTLLAGGTFLTGGNLGFAQVANGGGYITLSSGAYNLSASGPTVTTPIQLTGQTFSGNSATYTVVAAGETAQTGTFAPQLLLIPNYTANQLSLPAGDAAVRVVNLSLNPNPIGLYATASGAPSTVLGTGLGSFPFGYSSAANGYVAVPTTQLVNMAVVDATHPQTSLSLASTSTLNTFTFTAGQAYTLYVLGQPANSSESLVALWVADYPAP